MNEVELKEKLLLHRKWLMNEPGGCRANLSGANLSFADLGFAYSGWTNLNKAKLKGANLSRADLT